MPLGKDSRPLRRLERLGILLALVVIGLGLSAYVPLPSPVLSLRLPGAFSPISVTLTPVRQVSLVVALLACVAIDSIMRAQPQLPDTGFARTVPYWVLPVFLILCAFGAFEGLTGALQQVLGLAAVAGLLGLLMLAQLQTLDPGSRWAQLARLGLNAATYGLALATFITAYRLPARALLAPLVVALASLALALQLLETTRASTRRVWVSAALAGLMMAEVAWALNMGTFSPLATGFLLLLAFYGLTGVIQQLFWGRLTRQVAVEFAVVAVLVLAIVLRFGA